MVNPVSASLDVLYGPDPMKQALADGKITPAYLVRKLKQELAYKEKYERKEEDGHGIVKRVESPAAKRIQQEARKDAHKLLGHYPAEKHELEHSGAVTIEPVNFADAIPDDQD